VRAGDLLGGLDPRPVGHVDVEEHRVGADLERPLDRLPPARHLRDDLVPERREQVHDRGARGEVVLGDQDAYGGRGGGGRRHRRDSD